VLFPGVPVVFCGINDFKPARIAGRKGFTGISEGYDVRGTISMMLDLHPETDKIVIVLDNTVSGLAFKASLLRAESFYNELVEVEYLEDLAPPKLRQELSLLPAKTLILWAIYLRTPSGRFVPVKESLELIISATDLPVYSLWDVVGMGVVGGKIIDPCIKGEQTAEIVLKVLSGTDIDSIPVKSSPLTYVFDYQAMNRYGLRPSDLPEERIILNRPFSFIREYTAIVILTIALVVMLIVIILILLNEREQHRSMNRIIKEALSEKTVLLKELYHRTRNNMQVLISMLSLSRVSNENPELDEILKELENKFFSISLVHKELYKDRNLSRIDFCEYLFDLTAMLGSSYNVESKDISIEFDIEPMTVNIDIAVPIGLVLSELLTNTLKYAFPDDSGIINICITREVEQIQILYKDDGIGVDEDFDLKNTSSLGLQSVFETVCSQLSGEIECVNENGLKYILKFKDVVDNGRL